MFVRSVCVCLPLLVAASPALAQSVALSPLLVDVTVRPEDRAGVHQVLSSELDFAPEVTRLRELTKVPAGLDDWCLTNARCMTGITNALEVDGIVAGRISMAEANLVLDLVYFLNGKLERRKAFVVPRDPTGLANAMSPVTRELLTGENPRAVAASAPTEEDFEVDDEIELGVQEEIGDFGFGNASPDEISVATIDDAPPARTRPRPAPVVDTPADPTRAPEPPPGRTAAAEPATSRVSTTPARRPTTRGASEGRIRTEQEPHRSPVDITLRGGYSPYFSFDFVTGGGEAAIRLGNHLQLVAGVELYAVRRLLPQRIQEIEGKAWQWDTIYPVNFGFLYEFGDGELRPYIGVDGIVTQYYRDEIGGDYAGGARARVGLDYMASKHFGLNLNLAAGAWTGQNWPLIEQSLGQTGFLPQVSAGAIIAL